MKVARPGRVASATVIAWNFLVAVVLASWAVPRLGPDIAHLQDSSNHCADPAVLGALAFAVCVIGFSTYAGLERIATRAKKQVRRSAPETDTALGTALGAGAFAGFLGTLLAAVTAIPIGFVLYFVLGTWTALRCWN